MFHRPRLPAHRIVPAPGRETGRVSGDGGRGPIDELVERMDGLLAGLEARQDPAWYFLATYRRTTVAVKEELERGGFADREWVERWDILFADLYLRALEAREAGRTPPGPWEEAFGASQGVRLPPLRHVLLGMNAHVNYDLPQALLGSITDDDFADEALVARRAADHAHVDRVLVARVGPEDVELAKVEQPGDRTTLDRLMTPFNRSGTKRFLREARAKTWHNARLLSQARRQGPDELAVRLRQLEDLSRRRVADLKAPGQVLVKLAVKGFGVQLPG